MKVGVYFPSYDPSAGGAHTFEQEMLQAVIKLAPECNHHFTLFFEEPASSSTKSTVFTGTNINSVSIQSVPPLSEKPGLLVRVINKVGGALGAKPNSKNVTPLQKEIHKQHIDFIWFSTAVYQPVPVPYMATVWDIQHRLQPWFPEVSNDGQWDNRELYYSTYLRQATFVLACNETARRELSFFYQIPEKRFCLLPHPTPLIEQIPSKENVVSTLLKYRISAPYLFYPAQFWAHKNHINLLMALKILHNDYHLDFQLVLVGSDQGNKQYVQNKVDEFGLTDRVHVLGFVPRQDLIALYRGAFALSYVTYFGPENMPPLEAFVLECPVIASRVSGADEQLGDAAFLVNGSQPREIALAVKTLYDDPALRESLVVKGRVRASQFTSLDYVKTVFSLFDEFEPVRRNWGS